jgi:putative ABC transport system permease protein
LDPNLPIYDVDSMEGALETATWAFGLFGTLFSIFGGIALFMSAVGLYGVMAFSVSSRTQEMGIRMALGASASKILGMIFKKGFIQLGVGMLVGLGLGAAMSQPMRAIMFDVNPNDPTVYLTIVLVLVIAGVFACFVPARRATKVELVDALRPE